MSTQTQARPAFGTVLADQMAIASFRYGRWGPHEFRKTGPIEIHPASGSGSASSRALWRMRSMCLSMRNTRMLPSAQR